MATFTRTLLALLFCGLVSGCHVRTATGDEVVHQVAWWPPLLLIAAGIAVVAMGVSMWRQKHVFRGGGLCLLAVVLLVGWAPGMYLEKVVVTPTEVTSTHGMLWNQQTDRIVFADVAEVRAEHTTSRGRRGTRHHYALICRLTSGDATRVPLGDLMQAAVPDILAQFQAHNIPVLDRQALPTPGT